MIKKNISKLFNNGGLVISNFDHLNIKKKQIKEIIFNFEKYGVIIFKHLKITPDELTKFTDYFSETYAGDALRRVERFGKKNIRSVDVGNQEIILHSEASFTPAWPELVWFFCLKPPINKQGATTLCDGLMLWKKLSNKTKNFFLSNPIVYDLKIPVNIKKRNIKKKPWSLNEPGISNCFIDYKNGLLNLELTRFAVHKGRNEQDLCFANHLLIDLDSEDQLIKRTLLANKKIPKLILNEIKKKAEELTYEIKWEKNDLVMIDNKRFMHGRRAYKKNNPRDIIVIQTSKATFSYGTTFRKIA
jgi:alpha-ketoglutarate-dependent taurine dioxygenase